MILEIIDGKRSQGFTTICVCDNCGLEFKKKYCEAKRAKHHFCSKDCRVEHWRGKETPLIGTKLSDATKLKISNSRIGKGYGYKIGNTVWLGKHHTEEEKLKIGLAQKGSKHHNWGGGRTKDIKGYILIHKPEHPFAKIGGYVCEHRLVMEESLGRYLLRKEVIHHINKIKDDNRIENLMLFENDIEHRKYHGLLKKVS